MPGKVKVKILAGRNLPVMDRGSDTTDAYVEIKIGSITHKTDVCRKSLHPQWNSDWYRFEIDDADLQDEPLQIRLMDHDTYSANDAIGKVSISLNPLLLPPPTAPDGHPVTSHSGKGVVMAGWIPVFDTMHGIRGEVNVIVKVDLFSDVNKFRQSSCGVHFFHSPIIPHGYHAQVIHGFVDELVVNDDPEYQWIDKIRTPRASNEARQIVFLKLSGQVQRKIGLKALDLGANAVIGYTQCFDLEGDVGVVARGIGTAVTLVKLHDFTPQPNVDAALAEERALKYLKFLAADSGNPSKFDPSFNTSYFDVNKILDNITPEKTLDLINNEENETLTPTRMGSHFPGVGKQKLRKPHKRHPILFVSQSQMMSNRNISSTSDLNTSCEGIDGDSLRIRLEQEDNRGVVAGNRFSRGIKTSKNILSKKMTALKAKLSDSQMDDGSGLDSSLNSSFSDLSVRSSLADLCSEVKKVKKFKPKFKRSSSDGTGMAALLVRSVMQVHTSLDCIIENHDSPAQSPQASMRRESRTKPEKVLDVGSSSEELKSLDQINILTEVPPIVIIDQSDEQETTPDFIPSMPSTEELPISSDGSLSSESSSSDCELSEDGDTDTKIDLAATPDTISLVVKTVLAQESNKSFADDWIKPINTENIYTGIQSDGEAVLETTLGHTIHAIDVLKTKRENEDDNYGENIHPDASKRNKEQVPHLVLPPVIDNPNLKNSQGLVGTAMQTMLMERVNILGSITDTPTKPDKAMFTFDTGLHASEDKSFSEPTSPSYHTEEHFHAKKHDHGFKHIFERIGSAMHSPPVLKKRFSFSHHDKKAHDTPTGMSSSESNPTLAKDHSDLRHLIFKPIFNNGRNVSEMELPTVRMIKGEKKHGSSPSLLKSVLKDNKEHKSMFHRPRFISFSHSKSYDPDLLLSKNKKHGSTPSLHKEIHKHKHFFHRPKFLFSHSHKTSSSEPTSPKKVNLKHTDGLIGTAIQTILMEKVNIMGEILDKSPIIGDEQHLNSPPVDRETVLGTTFSSPDIISAPTLFHDRPWFTPSHTPTRDTVLGSPFMSLIDLKQEYPNVEMKDSPFSSQISLEREFKVDSPRFYEDSHHTLLDTAMETILMDRVHTILATSPQSTPPIVQRQVSLKDVSEKLKQLDINREQSENTNLEAGEIQRNNEYVPDTPQFKVFNFQDQGSCEQIISEPEIPKDSKDFYRDQIEIQSTPVNSLRFNSLDQSQNYFSENNKSEEHVASTSKRTTDIHDNEISLDKIPAKHNKTLHVSISDNSILCATNSSLHGSIPILSSEQPRPISPNKNQGHHRTESAGKTPQSPARGINTNLNSVHRRSSDSDLSVTPKGLIRKRNSLTSGGGERNTQRQSSAGGVLRPSMQQDNLDMLEYPFLTMAKYPAGFIQHLGGVVAARSVKLLERVPNPDEPETRDTWWAELRMEIRSHARALACNVVLGYSEVTTISDDICVLSATGTAAVINLQYSNDTTDVAMGKTTHAPPLQSNIPKELMTTSLDRQEFENDKELGRLHKLHLDGKDSIRVGVANDNIVEEENNTSCTLPVPPAAAVLACAICHIPYSPSTVPFRVNLIPCAVCGKSKVPDVLFSTVEVPDGLPVTGRGCLLQAHVLRPKRDLRSELNAREISDGLPFLEYELHRLLISKLKVKGMNAIFGLKATVAIGERMIAAVATGTAVFLTALPPPSAPIVTAGNSWSDLQRLGELQRALQETVDKNREVYQLKPLTELNPTIEGNEEVEEEQVDLDFAAGNKDTCILEVDDAEDLEVFSLLMEPRPPDGFHVVNTQAVPGLQGLEVVRNLQAFTQVWRTKLPQNQPATYFPQHFQKLLQSVYYKLRCMIPCAICELRFRLDLPEPDEVQLLVTGMALGLGEPSKISKYKRKMMVHSSSKEAVKKSDDDLIFSLEEEQVTDLNSTAATAKPRSRSPSGLKPRNSYNRLSRHMPLKERYGVDITPLNYVPGGRIDRYLGNLNFFFIRESTSVRENGGISGFIHSFITEILAIVRAHVTALGGNALVAYYMTELILGDNPHKNQGQCLVSVGGDVVFVSYYPDD